VLLSLCLCFCCTYGLAFQTFYKRDIQLTADKVCIDAVPAPRHPFEILLNNRHIFDAPQLARHTMFTYDLKIKTIKHTSLSNAGWMILEIQTWLCNTRMQYRQRMAGAGSTYA
jgi:hypothetical protein